MKKTTKQVPYRCPICNGTQSVPTYYYSSGWGSTTDASNMPTPCRTCNGTGVIYAEEITEYFNATAH